MPGCTQKGKHHHVFNYQTGIIESIAKYRCLIGGYGGGKTLPGCILGLLLSIAIPGNIGIVCRRSYSKLHDSTERIFLEVVERSGYPYETKENREGWPHRLIFENGSEVVFRETKDLGRFLGPQYGWFLIDEALEEPRKTFNDLVGRLRLPRARQSLVGIICTNPPSERHWIAQLFGEPGLREKIDPVTQRGVYWETWRCTSYDNPFLPAEYIGDLRATHSASEVRRIVEGRYGFSFEGKPVYGNEFGYERNVGEPLVHPIAIVRSWDFGYHCPAVTWHQFFKCKAGRTHWHVLAELVGQDIEAEHFATKVLEYSAKLFSNHPRQLWTDCGDIAGKYKTDKGPGPMIRLFARPWNLVFYTRKCNLEPGIALIRESLTEVCKCGSPIMLVHRRCPTLIDGLAGGYHYPKENPGREISVKPVKDGLYDNVCDSVRYAGENNVRLMNIPQEILDMMAAERAANKLPMVKDPYSWMGWH